MRFGHDQRVEHMASGEREEGRAERESKLSVAREVRVEGLLWSCTSPVDGTQCGSRRLVAIAGRR